MHQVILITGPSNPDYWVKYPVIRITGPSNQDYWVLDPVIRITTPSNLQNYRYTYIFIQIPFFNDDFDHLCLYNRAKGIIKILVVDIAVGRTNVSKFVSFLVIIVNKRTFLLIFINYLPFQVKEGGVMPLDLQV